MALVIHPNSISHTFFFVDYDSDLLDNFMSIKTSSFKTIALVSYSLYLEWFPFSLHCFLLMVQVLSKTINISIAFYLEYNLLSHCPILAIGRPYNNLVFIFIHVFPQHKFYEDIALKFLLTTLSLELRKMVDYSRCSSRISFGWVKTFSSSIASLNRLM